MQLMIGHWQLKLQIHWQEQQYVQILIGLMKMMQLLKVMIWSLADYWKSWQVEGGEALCDDGNCSVRNEDSPSCKRVYNGFWFQERHTFGNALSHVGNHNALSQSFS